MTGDVYIPVTLRRPAAMVAPLDGSSWFNQATLVLTFADKGDQGCFSVEMGTNP